MNWFIEDVVMLVATLATWATVALLLIWVPMRLIKFGPYAATGKVLLLLGVVSFVSWLIVLLWVLFSPGGWH
jgi:hypothetical protein